MTSWAFTFTSRRTRKSSISKEHTFIRDSSVSTLDRELPVVIQRIRDAGLAPVFVVDELDKIDDLEKAMEKLILRLKHLVADFSFFCFLTDRDYYEYLRDLSVRLPYPRAHTYFSHRIFVHYRPSDLHTYLNQVLESARKDKEKEEASDEEDRISRCALSYLLLHRARMHTFDLQRELSKICDDRGWITLSPSALVSHLGFRFNVAAQLAIEHLLNEDELRDRVEQDPHFGQLAYDALYYVSRSWAAGESELDISEEKIDQYLTTRLWHKEVEEADLGRQTTNGHAEITSPVSSRLQDRALSPIDRRFLLDRVERIVEFLVTPTVLVDKLLVKLSEVGDTSLENNTIIRTIPTDRNTPLLTVIGHNRYRWCRDIYGRLLHGEAGRRISFEIQKKASEFIDEFVKSLRRFMGQGFSPLNLSHLGIVSLTPDWREVQAARDRLRESLRRPYEKEQMEIDQALISEYVDMLCQRASVMRLSFGLACKVGQATHPNKEPELKFADGLNAVGRMLGLQSRHEAGLVATMDEIDAPQEFNIQIEIPELNENDLVSWRDGISNLRDGIFQIRSVKDLQAYRQEAWDRWNARLIENQPAEWWRFPVTFSDLVSFTAKATPSTIFVHDSRLMTIGNWSRLIENAFRVLSKEHDEYVPYWAIAPAMGALGLSEAIALVFQELRDRVKDSSFNSEDLSEASEKKWVAATKAMRRPKIRGFVLLITMDEASVIERWEPSASFASLAVRRKYVRETAQFLHLISRVLPDKMINYVIEERESVSEEQEPISLPAPFSSFPSVLHIPTRADQTTNEPVISDVDSLDQAVRRARRLLMAKEKRSEAEPQGILEEVGLKSSGVRKGRNLG